MTQHEISRAVGVPQAKSPPAACHPPTLQNASSSLHDNNTSTCATKAEDTTLVGLPCSVYATSIKPVQVSGRLLLLPTTQCFSSGGHIRTVGLL